MKLKEAKVLFSNLGGQNRKFVKLEGSKVHFSLNLYINIPFTDALSQMLSDAKKIEGEFINKIKDRGQ